MFALAELPHVSGVNLGVHFIHSAAVLLMIVVNLFLVRPALSSQMPAQTSCVAHLPVPLESAAGLAREGADPFIPRTYSGCHRDKREGAAWKPKMQG